MTIRKVWSFDISVQTFQTDGNPIYTHGHVFTLMKYQELMIKIIIIRSSADKKFLPGDPERKIFSQTDDHP